MLSPCPGHPTKSSTVCFREQAARGLHYSLYSLGVLRVVRKGPAIKNEVDDAIDLCAEVFNLRDAIEESRVLCEQAMDEKQKKTLAAKGTCSGFKLSVYPEMVQTITSFAKPETVF